MLLFELKLSSIRRGNYTLSEVQKELSGIMS